MEEEFENIDFNFPTNNPSIIKVITSVKLYFPIFPLE